MRRDKREHAYEPNSGDLRASLNTLKGMAQWAGSRPVDVDDARILIRYIEFLEQELGQVIEQFQGIPTEYFNMIRRERMEWRALGPTPIF